MLKERKFSEAFKMRGQQFVESHQVFVTVARPKPHTPAQGKRPHILVMHSGASAPGMNTAVRAAVRLGLDSG